MRIVAFPGILVMVAMLVACGGRPKIGKLSESSIIVAFGDSLTSGVGAGKGESYPDVLTQLLGCTVINEGISGEDTTEGLSRLPAVLEEYRPDLVLLCHGGNDFLQKQPNKVTHENLEAMLGLIQASGADVIMVGVPQPGLRLKVPDLYKDLAEDYAVPLDDTIISAVLLSSDVASDLVHPNAEGYRRIADAFLSLIRAAEES